jgi:muramoyltetrapeptide carboxypeptidase LdcA involved in peptidoglycan recycling
LTATDGPIRVPAPLGAGDLVRVIAPSRSLTVLEEGNPIGEANSRLAVSRLEGLGLRVSFGANVRINDAWGSSPVATRLEDLHAAFADPEVKAILTVVGGWNGNQLLSHVDWDLVRAHPKHLCGYSDVSALQNAMLARASLQTWSGPHFSTFGMRDGIAYTLEGFRRALFTDESYALEPSPQWSDDAWFHDQDARQFRANPGPRVIQPGVGEGVVVGANLSTWALLFGTSFMPALEGTVVFLEALMPPTTFDRVLQSLCHQPGFGAVRGLVIGRFQQGFGVTDDVLAAIVGSKPELRGLPVIAGLDFGHTTPHATFPLGGKARVVADPARPGVEILRNR